VVATSLPTGVTRPTPVTATLRAPHHVAAPGRDVDARGRHRLSIGFRRQHERRGVALRRPHLGGQGERLAGGVNERTLTWSSARTRAASCAANAATRRPPQREVDLRVEQQRRGNTGRFGK
jgi:hypothetical protein